MQNEANWPYPINRGDVEFLIREHLRDGRKHIGGGMDSSGSYILKVAAALQWCLDQIDAQPAHHQGSAQYGPTRLLDQESRDALRNGLQELTAKEGSAQGEPVAWHFTADMRTNDGWWKIYRDGDIFNDEAIIASVPDNETAKRICEAHNRDSEVARLREDLDECRSRLIDAIEETYKLSSERDALREEARQWEARCEAAWKTIDDDNTEMVRKAQLIAALRDRVAGLAAKWKTGDLDEPYRDYSYRQKMADELLAAIAQQGASQPTGEQK